MSVSPNLTSEYERGPTERRVGRYVRSFFGRETLHCSTPAPRQSERMIFINRASHPFAPHCVPPPRRLVTVITLSSVPSYTVYESTTTTAIQPNTDISQDEDTGRVKNMLLLCFAAFVTTDKKYYTTNQLRKTSTRQIDYQATTISVNCLPISEQPYKTYERGRDGWIENINL